MTTLKIENLSINFGGVKALDNVNMEIPQGEIHGLMGPNGSGKSTLLNVLSRIYNPTSGSVTFGGKDIIKCKAHQMTAMGVGRTFQNLELFNNMTALQNVMVSQTLNQDYSLLSSAFYTRRFKRVEKASVDRAMEMLELMGLEHLYRRLAQDLSFGQQKLLELARALVFNPKLLLLDEPAAGLSPVMVDQFLDIIKKYRQEKGLTVIIVEHVVKLIMENADRITVLNFGQVLAEGTPEEIQGNKEVIDVYLGRGIKKAFDILPKNGRETVIVGDSYDDRTDYSLGEEMGRDEQAQDEFDLKDDDHCLIVEGIDAYYGKLKVLYDVSLRIPDGSIVALLGGNGSGKSTTLNAISGLVDVKAGTIKYGGKLLPQKQPHKIVRMGIVQVPQHREVFPYLNVKENLAMGAYRRRDKKGIEEDYERVYTYFPRLKERRKQLAASMSGGEQQMLAIGRALMTKPKVLVMDEPSASLAPTLVEEIFRQLVEINKGGTTLFIVEQNVEVALSVAQYVYIMRQGRIVLEDNAHAIRGDEKIISSYFGSASI